MHLITTGTANITSGNATQIISVWILKIEGICTLERRKIVQEKMGAGGGVEMDS